MTKYCYFDIPATLEEVLQDIGGTTSDDYDEIVNASYSAFFSFYTPVKLTTAMATDLEKFILHYFILRRIGCNNVQKWKQMFRNKWCAIIPYYERLLETQDNESHYFTDPIKNSGTYKEGATAKDVTSSGSASGSSNEINRYLDTPQGDASRVWSVDSQGHIVLNDTYLTDIRAINDNNSSTRSDTGEELGTYNETRNGFDGVSPAELLLKYRELFLRIYEDIANELEECFYNLVEFEDFV